MLNAKRSAHLVSLAKSQAILQEQQPDLADKENQYNKSDDSLLDSDFEQDCSDSSEMEGTPDKTKNLRKSPRKQQCLFPPKNPCETISQLGTSCNEQSSSEMQEFLPHVSSTPVQVAVRNSVETPCSESTTPQDPVAEEIASNNNKNTGSANNISPTPNLPTRVAAPTNSPIISNTTVTNGHQNQLLQRSPLNDSSLFGNRINLRAQLVQSRTGQVILRAFDVEGGMSNQNRKRLVRFITDEEMGPTFSNVITPEMFTNLSKQICQLFPGEDEEVYYVPYTKINGIVSRARGKLMDRYFNTRKDAKEQGLLQPLGQAATAVAPPGDLNVTAEVEDDLLYIQTHDEPWNEIEDKFANTSKVRLARFKGKTIDEYLKQYPALFKSKGFRLITADFKLKYGDRENVLLAKWPEIESNVLKLAQKKTAKRDFRTALESLDINLNHPVGSAERTITALFVLPLLFASVSVIRGWKPARPELKDGFLLHIEVLGDFNKKLEERNEKLRLNRCEATPIPLVVGDLNNPDFFVWMRDGTYYKCPTVLSAIDLTFKIFAILPSLQFSPVSAVTWSLFENFIYKINRPGTKYPSARLVARDLGLL